MSSNGFFDNNTPNYVKFCIKLQDGSVVYRLVAEECPGCNNDYEKEYYTDELGTQILEPDLSGATECDNHPVQCKKSSTLYTIVDNTGTRFQWTAEIRLTFTDGSSTVITQTPTTGWSAQLNQWVGLFQTAISSKCNDAVAEARCNILPAGCGGLLPPPTELQGTIPEMLARYLQILSCPTCPAIRNVELLSINGTELAEPRPLVMKFVKGQESRYDLCQNCGEEGVLYHQNTNTEVLPQDYPICLFDCAEDIPEVPESTCNFELVEICDSDRPTDQTFVQFADCGSGQIVNAFYFVDPDGALEEYIPNPGSVGPCGVETSSSVQCDSCGNQLEVVLYDDGVVLYYDYSTGSRGDLTSPIGDVGKCEDALYLIKTETKCLGADTSTLSNSEFIGTAAQGSAGYVTWESALSGQPVLLDQPAPNGSTPLYSGTQGSISYTAEHVGYLSSTALSSLPRYSMTIETPASQGGTSATFSGFDGNGSNSNPNAILFTFSTPIGAMSFTALDLESETINAEVYLYDAAENLINQITVVYPGAETGGGEAHNIGFTRTQNEVSYVLVVVGATAAMSTQNNNRLAVGDIRFVEYIEQTYSVETWGSPGSLDRTCYVYDENKQLVDVDIETLSDCSNSSEGCGEFTGDCRCYGGSSIEPFIYENQDTTTDISFSTNATEIKWYIELGQQTEADATGGFIQDCINDGGQVVLTITDSVGNVVIFTADTVSNDGTLDGQWLFSGTGPGGFSGKVSSVEIQCGASTSFGKACSRVTCDGTAEWVDSLSGSILTPDQVDTLVECTIPVNIEPPCDENLIQIIGCATETTAEVTVDDVILTLAVRDCNNVIVRAEQYNLTTGNTLLTSTVTTEDCSPEPGVTQTEECILDTQLAKWTEITIVDGISITVLYVNQEILEIGTPQGSPSEWNSCVEGVFHTEQNQVCVNSIQFDGETWVVGDSCNGGPVFYSTTSDRAILDEQTIVGGWAIVVASSIINCGVEAASVLPDTPPTDPLLLDQTQCTINQHSVYNETTGQVEFVYYTDLSNNNNIADVVLVKCQEIFESCDLSQDLTLNDIVFEKPNAITLQLLADLGGSSNDTRAFTTTQLSQINTNNEILSEYSIVDPNSPADSLLRGAIAPISIQFPECYNPADTVDIEYRYQGSNTISPNTPTNPVGDGGISILNPSDGTVGAFYSSPVNIPSGSGGPFNFLVTATVTVQDIIDGNVALLLGLQTVDGAAGLGTGISWDGDITITIANSVSSTCQDQQYTLAGLTECDKTFLSELVDSNTKCCPEIMEHYLCLDGIKTPVWVSLDPENLEILKVINTLNLQDVTNQSLNGFIDPCDDCNITACMLMDAFDVFDETTVTAGDFQELGIMVDGVMSSIVVHDYTTTSDGVNKSSWYTPWAAAINALPEWSISVEEDANVDNSSPFGISGNNKMTWKIEYSGISAQTLRLYKGLVGDSPAVNDYLQISVDAAGTVTTETGSGTTIDLWSTYPFHECI